MIVGVCRIGLFFPASGSLKEKRHGLRKIIDRLRAKYNAAVAEVGQQDTWQRSLLGITVVGNEYRHVESMLENIIMAVENMYVAQMVDRQTDIVTYNDTQDLGG